jgi:hypothetical protein
LEQKPVLGCKRFDAEKLELGYSMTKRWGEQTVTDSTRMTALQNVYKWTVFHMMELFVGENRT